jgi:hypothetical protein
MSKQRSLQPFRDVLAADATLAAWRARALAEADLTAAVRRHLPRAIADRVHVAEAAAATLTLATSTGTIAAVVRQRLPVILGGLLREGCNFTEIRVRVQVRADPSQSTKVVKIQRQSADPAPLNRLAETLADGPLKAALRRLARRI